MDLLIATTNPGKVKEFREMLAHTGVAFSDLSGHRGIPAPEETGQTFRANACLKAACYAQKLNTWTVADDSGLAVDALAGSPAVHSARWAEMNRAGKGDADNNALLIPAHLGGNHAAEVVRDGDKFAIKGWAPFRAS